jgi:hypothetical protein
MVLLEEVEPLGRRVGILLVRGGAFGPSSVDAGPVFVNKGQRDLKRRERMKRNKNDDDGKR